MVDREFGVLELWRTTFSQMGLSLGLPLHLRCIDLLRAIGNRCGGFVAADFGEDGWGVEVRIKVIDRGKVEYQCIVGVDQWWYSVSVGEIQQLVMGKIADLRRVAGASKVSVWD